MRPDPTGFVHSRKLKGLHPRIRFRVADATRAVVDSLEPRRLLSGLTASQVQAAVPAGVHAAVNSDGAALLSLAPQTTTGTQTTSLPSYVELDPHPSITTGGTLASFSTSTPTGYLPAVVRHAYGVDQIMFGSVIGDGTGQTIAIVDAYDYPTASTDLHAFDLAAGLPDPPSFMRVNQTGGNALPGVDPEYKGTDWELEEALDVEWSHALAPAASIVLVEAASPNDSDLMSTAVAYARSIPGVVAVSMSFGRSEDATADPTLNTLFTTPVGHTGVTFLASTGDNAAPGYFPAYSPNVVATGGTTLNLDATGRYISETGWALGGGGISTVETQPAFQNGVVTQSSTQRTIPDVSSDADPNTGVAIYDTYDFGVADPWITVGGTSVASPTWAGLIAVADQGRGLGGGSSLDGASQTLPRLYSIPAGSYHDITSGNNGFTAGPGYDLVTGRGSPLANTLVQELASTGPTVSSATPSGILTTAPSSLSFNFSTAMNPSTFSIAGSVDSFTGPGNVNLISSITGYSWSNSNTTLQVNFTAPTLQGLYSLVIGPHILSSTGLAMDQNLNNIPGETPGDEFTAHFNFDSSPLVVTSTTPATGGVLTGPSGTLSVTFNQPIDPSTASVSNLNLSEGTVSAVGVLAGNTTVQYTISGLTTNGTLSATLAAGALNDSNGNPLYTPFTGSYIVDIPTAPLPAPFTSTGLAGSMIYTSPGASDYIQFAGDSHGYTVNLDANQTLTLTLRGSSTLQPIVQVRGPGAALLGTASAGAGQSVSLQTVPVTTAGVYTITVAGVNNSTGVFWLGATLNAAIGADNFGAPANQTLATAQNISGSFLSLSSGVSRGAVIGAPLSGASTLQDYYSFPLNAGDSISLALSAALPGSDSISLLGPSGTVLASGAGGAANVDQSISSFVAPSSGTYFLLVSAASGASSYQVVALRNAVFSLQPHGSFATAQSLDASQGVLGYLGSAPSGTVLTVNAANEGWWDATGTHQQDNTNYIVGDSSQNAGLEYRDYFVFDLEGLTQIITGAQLNIFNPAGGYSSGKPSDTYSVFDVSTSIAALESSGSGQETIFNDLGSGVSYGTTTVSSASNGAQVNVPLNSAAVTALNAADGGQFAVGGALPTFSRGNDYLFANTSSMEPQQLVLNLGGGADWYSVNVASAGTSLAFSTTTPGDGSGQFGNLANLQLQIFDPNGNLVASGTKLADGRNETVNYQALTTGQYRVEVSPLNGSTGEYVLQRGNTLQLGLPANVNQGQGVVTGTLTASSAPTSDLTITLTSSDPTRLNVPATVVLPAGQTTVAVPINALTSSLLEGPEAITITASGATYFSASEVVTVHSTQAAVLSVSLPASMAKNGGSVTGTVTCSSAPAQDVVVSLASSLTSALTVPATVTILAGHTSATFTATIINNTVLTGNVSVNVTASVENWTTGTASINILETNNTMTLALPASGWEGQILNGGLVSVGGTVTVPTVISLISSNPAELSVPNTVIIPTGSSSVAFSITLINDGIKFGSHVLTVSASGTGLNSPVPTGMTVYDSNLDHLGFAPITGPVTAGTPFTATVDAYNVGGLIIAVYNSTGSLSAAGQAGVVPVSPTSANFSSGVWTAGVTLTLADPATSLTLTSGGVTATSNSFAVQAGAVSSLTWGAVSTPQTANIPFAETITATDAYGNLATGFNGTAALSGLALLTGGASTMVPISPASATFVNGVWSGNITVPQAQTAMQLHVADTKGDSGNSGTFTVIQRALSLGLPTDTQEGDGVDYGVLSVTPAPATNLVVTLTSSDPSRLSVPATITIPAGQTSVTVPLTIIQTNSLDALESVTVMAGASTYATATASVNVHSSQSAVLSVSIASSITKGDVVTGTVRASQAPAQNISIALTSSNPAHASVPATITLLAGQTTATFTLTAVQNPNIDGTVAATISAAVDHWASGYRSVAIVDDNAYIYLSLPASGFEGQTLTNAAYVLIGGMLPTALTVNLSTTDPSQVSIPATITIPAGSTSAYFSVALLNDGIKGLSQTASITASAPGLSSSTASMVVHDSNVDHFRFAPISSPQMAGTPFGVTVTAYNLANEIIPVCNTTATLSASGQAGNLVVSPSVVIFASGVWTGTAAIATADPSAVLTITSGGVSSSSSSFAVQSTNVILNGAAGNSAFYLEFDSTGTNLQVWQQPSSIGSFNLSSAPTATYPLSGLSSIAVNGSGGPTVSATFDESNGWIAAPGGISFTGGANASGDALSIILPAGGATVSLGATSIIPAAITNAAVVYQQIASIIIDGATGNDTLIQTAQPAAAVSFNGGSGNDTLTVNAGTFTFATDPGLTTTALTLNDNSRVNFSAGRAGAGIHQVNLASLNVGAGAVADFADGASNGDRSLLITSGLSIAPTGQLDLGLNDAIIHGGSLSAITSALASGYNNGKWNGHGIASSAAGGNTAFLTTLATLLNNNGAGAPLYTQTNGQSRFDGLVPALNDVLIKYTYYGDTKLTGQVTSSSYTTIDNGFLSHLTGWSNGDLNYDGIINGSDYTLIDNAFNTQGASLAAQIAPGASDAEARSKTSGKTVASPAAIIAGQVFATGTGSGLAAGQSIESLLHDDDVLDRLSMLRIRHADAGRGQA